MALPVAALLCAALSCNHGSGCGPPLDSNMRLAAECRAAEPRLLWDGHSCRSRVRHRPVIDGAFGDANFVTLELRPGTTLAQTEELASSAGGRTLEVFVLGDDAWFADLELATTTKAELFATLKRLEASPLVVSAHPPVWRSHRHAGDGASSPVADGGIMAPVIAALQADCLSGRGSYRFHELLCESTVPARPRVSSGRGRGAYVNQVELRPLPSATLVQLEAVAASVGGRVVRRGYLQGRERQVVLEVPATTDAERDATIARLRRDPHVVSAAPQPVSAPDDGGPAAPGEAAERRR